MFTDKELKIIRKYNLINRAINNCKPVAVSDTVSGLLYPKGYCINDINEYIKKELVNIKKENTLWQILLKRIKKFNKQKAAM